MTFRRGQRAFYRGDEVVVTHVSSAPASVGGQWVGARFVDGGGTLGCFSVSLTKKRACAHAWVWRTGKLKGACVDCDKVVAIVRAAPRQSKS